MKFWFELSETECVKYAPGDACPCCESALVAAPQLTEGDPVVAVCPECARLGLEKMLAEELH